MKARSIAILLVIGVAALPLYYVYGYLKKKMKPGVSFGRFILFTVTIMILAFVYTFLVVVIISKLFPLASK